MFMYSSQCYLCSQKFCCKCSVTARATADPSIHPQTSHERERDQICNVIHSQGTARGQRWELPSPGRAAVRGCCSPLPGSRTVQRCQGDTEVLHRDPHKRCLQGNCSLRTRSPVLPPGSPRGPPRSPAQPARTQTGTAGVPGPVCQPRGRGWKDHVGRTESIPPVQPVFQALIWLSIKRLHQWDFLAFPEEVVLLLKALILLPTSFPSYLTYIFPSKSSFPSIIP